MSKPPAKAVATRKPLAKTAKPAPAAPARTKVAAKAPAAPVHAPKVATKSKPAPAAKAAPKAAAPKSKPAPAPAPKAAPVKSKPAPAPAPKAAPVKSIPAPAPKAAAAKTKPAPAPAPAPKPTPKPAAKAHANKSPASKAAPNPAPVISVPTPAANRFMDRFAPARRPAPRPMTETAELPKPAHKIDPKLANAWKHKPGRELTENELLAMPEAEYMKDKQVDFFRACLQQQKDDLLSNAGETTEHLREDTSIVPDPADRATIEEEHALELRTRDRERKLLKKIAQSLSRLESGEYGYCDETGEPIGLARLLARPTATLSLEAQQRRELKQKMFG